MVVETGVVLAFGSLAAGALGWSFQQKGRIDTLDREILSVQALNLERHTDTKERLERIEAKLDRLPRSLSTK